MKQQLYPVQNQDPLNSARALLEELWQVAGFEGMYLPRWADGGGIPEGGYIDQPSQLKTADPFAPVMPTNYAPAALETLRNHANSHTGVFLRPCEWRSFHVLANGSGDKLDHLFSISADCTGAMPLDDFSRFAKGDPQSMTPLVLHFASQGGILPSRHQTSCQLCENPYPKDVDLQFELFGIPTNEQLVLNFREAEIAQAFAERTLAGEVPPVVATRREQVLQDLARWRATSFEKRKAQLGPERLSLEGLIAHVRSCESCQTNLRSHCPQVDLEKLLELSNQNIERFQRWVSSCSGCGVCDKDCPQEYPLFAVIFSLRGIH